MEQKTCIRCKATQNISEFYKRKDRKTGYDGRCKACHRELALEWRHANLDRARASSSKWYKDHPEESNKKSINWYKNGNQWKVRDYRLRTFYGITSEQWEEMFASQGRKCSICRTSTPGEGSRNTWATDHDHTCCKGEKSCGKCIRAILCPKCNKGLGLMQDNPKTLMDSIIYLCKGSVS